MKKRLSGIYTFLLIATLTLNALVISLTFSSPEPTEIYVDPPNYIFNTATNGTIGTLFNVTVKVRNMDDMKTWQIKMYFNDSVINVTRWYEPTWDTDYVFHGKTTFPAPYPPDVKYGHDAPGVGWVGVGSSLFPAPSAGNGFTGDGLLCIITFNITAIPEGETYSCQLAIDDPKYTFWMKAGETVKRAYDTYTNGEYEISSPAAAYDVTIEAYCYTEAKEVSVNITKDGAPTGYSTPHTFTDLTGTHTFTVPDTDPNGHPFKEWSTGETSTTITVSSSATFTAYYEAPALTRLYVDPSEIINSTMTPCSTFHINITIDDVENMAICEFNLTYDTDVLSWSGISFLKVQDQMPSPSMDANDTAGYIWIRLAYRVPVTTSDPTPLVKIEFHLQERGATPLDLKDTKLLDPDGEQIPHEAIDGFFMTLIRDVAIVNVVPSRDWAYQGWPVNITITAKNLGNVNETFDVKACYDDSLIGTVSILDLAPDAEININITWDTSGVPDGVYGIKGEADTVPNEINTTNNIYMDGTVQIFTIIRDVAITSVVPSHSVAYPGWLVDINVTAENLGDVSETFNVTVFYNCNPIETIQVIDLASKAEINLTLTWNTSPVAPCYEYTITGEAAIVPFEYNTTNNVYVDGTIKVRLLGDVDGDNSVDMADISILVDVFLSYPEHPLWNPYADLDQNNVVDMADIAIAIDNFSESCPP